MVEHRHYVNVLPSMKQQISYVIAAILTLGLLYVAFRGVDLDGALHAAEGASLLPLIGGVLLMLASHALRAYRWQILLRPLKQRTQFWRAFKAVIIGYGANNVIPRSGEILRPYVLARGEGVPLVGTLATVVVERLADVIALALLIVFSLAVFRERLAHAFPELTSLIVPLLSIVLLSLVLFVLIFFSQRRTMKVIGVTKHVLPAKAFVKLEQFANEFSVGLQGVDRSAILPLVLGTAGIWGMYGLSMYVSLRAFDSPGMNAIGVTGAFVLLTLSGISFTIPTPGGTGTYHVFISRGLAELFAVPLQVGFAYAVLTHILSYVTVTVLGLVLLAREGVTFGAARKVQQETVTHEATASAVTPD